MSSRPPRQILLALGVISCLVVAGGVGVAAGGHPTAAQSRSAHVKPALGAGTATRAVHVRTGLIRITDTSEVQPGTSDGLVRMPAQIPAHGLWVLRQHERQGLPVARPS